MSLDRMRLHTYQELQTFVATAQEVREELEQLVGRELGVDFASLDVLEAFLLGRYPTVEAGLTLDQRGVLDAAARQVGLVLILGIQGARWDINLENGKDVYYRLPVVALPDGSVECPISMVTAALDRRTGSYLSAIAEALAQDCDAPPISKGSTKPRPKSRPPKSGRRSGRR